MEPTVHRATVADLEALLDLRMALLRATSEPDDGPEVRAANARYLAEHLPTGAFLARVVECGDAIVATSGLVLYHRPPSGHNSVGWEA